MLGHADGFHFHFHFFFVFFFFFPFSFFFSLFSFSVFFFIFLFPFSLFSFNIFSPFLRFSVSPFSFSPFLLFSLFPLFSLSFSFILFSLFFSLLFFSLCFLFSFSSLHFDWTLLKNGMTRIVRWCQDESYLFQGRGDRPRAGEHAILTPLDITQISLINWRSHSNQCPSVCSHVSFFAATRSSTRVITRGWKAARFAGTARASLEHSSN